VSFLPSIQTFRKRLAMVRGEIEKRGAKAAMIGSTIGGGIGTLAGGGTAPFTAGLQLASLLSPYATALRIPTSSTEIVGGVGGRLINTPQFGTVWSPYALP
jgi:hypothetical protein